MFLGRYPLLVSSGENIPSDKAYEILLRTIDFNQLDNNPRAYLESNKILEVLGLPKFTKAHEYLDQNIIAKFYKSMTEYIIITENSIYVVSSDIPTRKIT